MIKKISVNFCYILSFFSIFFYFLTSFYQPLIGDDIFVFYDVKNSEDFYSYFISKYNNWTGTMTYGNNANSAPTYTATNGTDNVSGTFTYDTSNARMGNRSLNSRLGSINQTEFLPQLFIERSMISINESLMRQRGNK